MPGNGQNRFGQPLRVLGGDGLQKLAEGSGHGIPVTISTDPRHSQVENVATALRSGAFSTWPEALGLAALRDPEAVREFAGIARREYLAVGIRTALHPQIDLATEPRWARQSATFGADAALTIDYLRTYLEGFQGEELGPDSVACVTKHFPGGGPQKDSEDPRFPYGREQVYPGGRFDLHLEPFLAAVEAGTAAIMPYYGMPVGLVYRGREIEEVGFGYNKQIITGVLRDEIGYGGVVVTDWQLVSDVHRRPARPRTQRAGAGSPPRRIAHAPADGRPVRATQRLRPGALLPRRQPRVQ
ncbi:glycoside hydrolase family 3 N-terminal domain-containing protein [Nonomuraea jabiensis]|uniref:glycoside hydrolase family 3 N-terminal domain-containing protein n=1 Tax=Nonomuraea jabiensis TaxID=882448 RepID=UPI003419E463